MWLWPAVLDSSEHNTSGIYDWIYLILMTECCWWRAWVLIRECFLLGDVHRESYDATVVLIYVFVRRTHTRANACLHVDTDPCICALLLVCVMYTGSINYYSYSSSRHDDNKPFKRTRCVCGGFSTRWRSNSIIRLAGTNSCLLFSSDLWLRWSLALVCFWISAYAVFKCIFGRQSRHIHISQGAVCVPCVK